MTPFFRLAGLWLIVAAAVLCGGLALRPACRTARCPAPRRQTRAPANLRTAQLRRPPQRPSTYG